MGQSERVRVRRMKRVFVPAGKQTRSISDLGLYSFFHPLMGGDKGNCIADAFIRRISTAGTRCSFEKLSEENARGARPGRRCRATISPGQKGSERGDQQAGGGGKDQSCRKQAAILVERAFGCPETDSLDDHFLLYNRLGHENVKSHIIDEGGS